MVGFLLSNERNRSDDPDTAGTQYPVIVGAPSHTVANRLVVVLGIPSLRLLEGELRGGVDLIESGIDLIVEIIDSLNKVNVRHLMLLSVLHGDRGGSLYNVGFLLITPI